MYMSFYVGAIGAGACLDKLSVVSNNLANVNNTGFRPKTASFQELINYNLNDSREPVTELQAGAAVKVQKTMTDFRANAVTQSNSRLDFAILDDNAFFMVRDPATGAVTYTRDGGFHRGQQADGTFLLLTDAGKQVLDANREPIVVEGENANAEVTKPGVFTFVRPSRLISAGSNEYAVQNDEMQPQLIEAPSLWSCALESSGTDVAKEFTRLIESQRAFTYALKMVTTSDEVEGTINALR